MTGRRRKAGRGLEEVLADRDHGGLASIVCEEAPGLREALHDSFVHADVDFGLVLEGLKATRSGRRAPQARQVISSEWAELRLTLEHLVYYTSRLQLFLACAVADEYDRTLGSIGKHVRLPRIREATEPGTSVAKIVTKGDRIEEYRLLADAALFIGAANLKFTRLLLGELNGVA